LRTIFLGGYLAIPILVELLQGLAGLGDFIGVNYPVLVKVECLDKRVHGALATHAAGTTGAAGAATRSSRATVTTRRTLPFGTLIGVLSREEARRSAER
jgi:hypothetical protein